MKDTAYVFKWGTKDGLWFNNYWTNYLHFFDLERKVPYFVVMESPAIRSYHQSAQTLLPTHVGDTTTIGARSLWTELLPFIFLSLGRFILKNEAKLFFIFDRYIARIFTQKSMD